MTAKPIKNMNENTENSVYKITITTDNKSVRTFTNIEYCNLYKDKLILKRVDSNSEIILFTNIIKTILFNRV